jgi:hypothetical protein
MSFEDDLDHLSRAPRNQRVDQGLFQSRLGYVCNLQPAGPRSPPLEGQARLLGVKIAAIM